MENIIRLPNIITIKGELFFNDDELIYRSDQIDLGFHVSLKTKIANLVYLNIKNEETNNIIYFNKYVKVIFYKAKFKFKVKLNWFFNMDKCKKIYFNNKLLYRNKEKWIINKY